MLPLRLIGPSGDEPYLGVALADALASRLGDSGRLIVRPMRGVLKHAEARPGLAARELGVEAVLDGSVQLSAGRLRVSLRLVPARRGGGLPPWSRAFEVPFTDVFEVQDEVAAQVTRTLLPSVAPAPAPARPTAEPAAYQAWLRGRCFWSRLSGPWLLRASACFHEAAELDPGFAAPHAGLAHAWVILGWSGLTPPGEAWEQAAREAALALERDPALPDALIARAFVALRDWDWTGATRDLDAAVQARPQDAGPVLWRGLFLALRGEAERAGRELARAEDLDPTAQIVSAARGLRGLSAGRPRGRAGAAAAHARAGPGPVPGALERGPGAPAVGRLDEALAAQRRAVELSEGGALMQAMLGHALARAGDTAAARAALGELRALAPRPTTPTSRPRCWPRWASPRRPSSSWREPATSAIRGCCCWGSTRCWRRSRASRGWPTCAGACSDPLGRAEPRGRRNSRRQPGGRVIEWSQVIPVRAPSFVARSCPVPA